MSHRADKVIQNLSIDCVVFGYENSILEVLLIKRKVSPEEGKWALPGGFILQDENIDDSALRILEETSNVKNIYLEQVHTFGKVERYPGRRVITISYFALINPDKHTLKPGSETKEVKWFPVKKLPEMPFDHLEILGTALKTLRQLVRHKPVGFELLPSKFTLTQLQSLYESIYDLKFDKRNFRKRILSMKLLTELEEFQKGVPHRVARLYKFDEAKYEELKKNGLSFEIK